MSQRQAAPVGVDDALFVRLDDHAVAATDWARGPWDPNHCHGAPPSALLVRAVENLQDGVWQLSRITIELQRPVPIEQPIEINTEVERPGSRISIVGATLSVGSAVVARARALRMRCSESSPPGVEHQVAPLPSSAANSLPMSPSFMTDERAYATDACDFRFASGSWSTPGAADVWIQLRVPLLAGEAISPVQRVAAAADFGNGVSAGVDHLDWLYINPDLTIHLARPPHGTWIGLSARSEYGDIGAGVACSHLHDEAGPIGMSAQSLLVEPR
jgi:hypothetical protein